MDGGVTENNYVSKLTTVTEGEWKGWQCYPGGDPFEDLAGPFYYRIGDDGRPVCAFRAEAKHMNGGGFMHGGCMMTFADFALFALAGVFVGAIATVTCTAMIYASLVLLGGSPTATRSAGRSTISPSGCRRSS